MELKWTGKALDDLERLHAALAPADPAAAAKVVRALVRAPHTLLSSPRMGAQLFQFEPREVRRILVGKYEIRYEIRGPVIDVLRLWRSREDR